MRTIIIADLHLGRSHKLVPDLTARTLDAFVRVAHNPTWDALLIAGDVFDFGTPHPTLIADFMAILKDIKRPVLINYGNHDVTRKGSATDPIKHIGSEYVQVVDEPGVYHVGGLRVYSENWPLQMRKGMTRELRIQEPHDCVMLHGSAMNHPNRPRDDWAYLVHTDAPKFFGHLHDRSMDPTGMYPGSLVPGNFSETHEAGGLVWDGESVYPFPLKGLHTFRTVEESVATTVTTKENQIIRVRAKSGRNLKLEKTVNERFKQAIVDYKPPENLVRAEAVEIWKAKTMMETYRVYLEGTGRDTSILMAAREFLDAAS